MISKTCQEAFAIKTSKRIYSVSEIRHKPSKNYPYRMRSYLAQAPPRMAISDDDRAFFVSLGQRIAERRKALTVTQVELAERLGISQQAMNSFEKGRRRVPVSLLPVIAQELDTTLDALITSNATTTSIAKKRGPQKKIQQQMKLIETLPIAKQRVIAQLIDSMLQSNA
jgi:transcriptional regulator with XRE-family HTH domain